MKHAINAAVDKCHGASTAAGWWNDKEGNSLTLHEGKSIIGVEECIQKFGVKPHQIRDFLALTGDVADNIPGCPSCGLMRARDLLLRFGSIKGIKAATDEEILSVRKVGLKTLTELRAWDPTLAVKLVTLLDDAPVVLEDLWAA